VEHLCVSGVLKLMQAELLENLLLPLSFMTRRSGSFFFFHFVFYPFININFDIDKTKIVVPFSLAYLLVIESDIIDF